jgi:hypothetical protein
VSSVQTVQPDLLAQLRPRFNENGAMDREIATRLRWTLLYKQTGSAGLVWAESVSNRS